MTDEEIQRVAKETGTPEAVIRTALPLIPVDKHSEWIGLLKSDNAASKMAHSYGWTVDHAISDIRGTSPPRKRSPMPLRFTIRDLLWLTALVALLLAWCIDHQVIVREMTAKLARQDKYAEELSRNWQAELNNAIERERVLRNRIESEREQYELIINRKKTQGDNISILPPPIMTSVPAK